MSAPSFTPGPWIVLGNSVGGPAIYTADKSKAIADVRTCGGVHVGGPQHPGTQANAHLISAAPDLLEALQLFVAWSEAERNHEGTTFWGRVDMLTALDASASAAIAKAAGAQP